MLFIKSKSNFRFNIFATNGMRKNMKYKFIKGTLFGCHVRFQTTYTDFKWKYLSLLMFAGDVIETQ